MDTMHVVQKKHFFKSNSEPFAAKFQEKDDNADKVFIILKSNHYNTDLKFR